jgi:hypothetical protein
MLGGETCRDFLTNPFSLSPPPLSVAVFLSLSATLARPSAMLTSTRHHTFTQLGSVWLNSLTVPRWQKRTTQHLCLWFSVADGLLSSSSFKTLGYTEIIGRLIILCIRGRERRGEREREGEAGRERGSRGREEEEERGFGWEGRRRRVEGEKGQGQRISRWRQYAHKHACTKACVHARARHNTHTANNTCERTSLCRSAPPPPPTAAPARARRCSAAHHARCASTSAVVTAFSFDANLRATSCWASKVW